MSRFLDFLENIIIKLIDKLNLVTIMLILVVFGYMNKSEVFEWIAAIGKHLPKL